MEARAATDDCSNTRELVIRRDGSIEFTDSNSGTTGTGYVLTQEALRGTDLVFTNTSVEGPSATPSTSSSSAADGATKAPARDLVFRHMPLVKVVTR